MMIQHTVQRATLLICILVLAGCRVPPEKPKADSRGMRPADVVRLALKAALAGDYDQANEYATVAYREREVRFRNHENPVMHVGSWVFRVKGVQDFESDIKFRRTEIYPKGFVIVPVNIPSLDENEYEQYFLVMRNGMWKIGNFNGDWENPAVH